MCSGYQTWSSIRRSVAASRRHRRYTVGGVATFLLLGFLLLAALFIAARDEIQRQERLQRIPDVVGAGANDA